MKDRGRRDPRALVARAYPLIAAGYLRSVRVLRWLRACRVIRQEDFVRVVWLDLPGRKPHAHAIKQLLGAQCGESIDEQQRVLLVGVQGAGVRSDVWIRTSTRAMLGEQVIR